MENHPIPIEQKSPSLKAFVNDLMHEVYRLRTASRDPQAPPALATALYPCLITDKDQPDDTNPSMNKIVDRGVDGKSIKRRAENILNEDPHLQKCCVTSSMLIQLLDGIVASILSVSGKPLTDSAFENRFEIEAERIYSEPFCVLSYSHIFNFSADADLIDFGEVHLRKMSPDSIRILLGETWPVPLLHLPQSGEYFIVKESSDLILNDLESIVEAHNTAEQLVRVFQYYKDGVVHLNYTTNFFRPTWLNVYRKYGTFYWGDNRRIPYENGKRFYTLDQGEYKDVSDWWKIYRQKKTQESLAKNDTTLGKALSLATAYFESSHVQIDSSKRLIDLSIALEAALSPHSQGEISFQLSQLAAEFIGSSLDEKQSIFDFVREMYKKRSQLIHGNKSSEKGDFIKNTDLEDLSSVLRKILQKLVALRINGEDDHEAVIKKIRAGLFDHKESESLAEAADINQLVRKYTHNSGPTAN